MLLASGMNLESHGSLYIYRRYVLRGVAIEWRVWRGEEGREEERGPAEGRDSLLKFAAGKASEKIARKPKLDSGRSNISTGKCRRLVSPRCGSQASIR
jgi:hypothetical protein